VLSPSNATVPQGGIKDYPVAESLRSDPRTAGEDGRAEALWRAPIAGTDLLISYFARALAERLIESRRAAESAR
jgi:hypothetical protein